MVQTRYTEATSLRHFKKNETLCRQGEEPDGWYELVEGLVRVCRYFGDGRRQVLAFVVPGDVFGFDSTSRQFSAEALLPGIIVSHRHEDCAPRIGRLPKSRSSHPALECALHAMESNLRFFSYPTAMQRLSAFLLDFQARLGLVEEIPLPMSRLDIAEHLGLTMHTISRSMAQLARDGLILCRSPHGIALRDRSRLAAYAGIEDQDFVFQPYSLVA